MTEDEVKALKIGDMIERRPHPKDPTTTHVLLRVTNTVSYGCVMATIVDLFNDNVRPATVGEAWGINVALHDEYFYVIGLSAKLEPVSMAPQESRVVYQDPPGRWRVKWNGRFIRSTFKTCADATQYLTNLREKRVEPEYE